tara:strand:+ start:6827 stop:8245 length:1419 start_codon:yes stop_codon:yes gene_type:complete
MEIKKKSEFIWEIEKTGNMKVPAIVYASEKLMNLIKRDKSLDQAKNVACLKGIQKASYVMPDAHQGYGFPIGGVAAFDMKKGIISPGGVGYDINCSVRLLSTNISVDDMMKKRKEVINLLFDNIPAGVGKKGKKRFSKEELTEVLAGGTKWAVEQGYGVKQDYEHTEDHGCLPNDPNAISERAMQRGMPQLGSLGAGNHFLEIQKIDQIYKPELAKTFMLDNKDNVVIMVHCGSRGLGHQVASDYIKEMEQKYGIKDLPDRQLINAPIQSDLGQKYLNAMGAAGNFAFANKQMITHWIRESLQKIFGKDSEANVVYDVCHNIAKIEKHQVDGKTKELCVHRKGATRSFGPGREELPQIYQKTGQPVLIPGSMGTASYVLVGTKQAEELSFASTAHGAGRVASRSEMLRNFRGEQIKKQMEQKDIFLKGASWKGIAEEAPQAYKDIDEVIRVSDSLGIGKTVVRVVPLGVIKG